MIMLILLAATQIQNASAGLPAALETLTGLGTPPLTGSPSPGAPEKAVSRKYYVGDGLFDYKPDADAKAAEYAASIRAAGIEVLSTAILTREDGDRTLYYFSIGYAATVTLKSVQQAGIPDKFRADFIHDDFSEGLRRAGFGMIRSGVRKESGLFTAYCLYAQEETDDREVRGYVSMPRQTSGQVDASALFADNMNSAISELEGAGLPVIFRVKASTGWTIKFVSAKKPKRLRGEPQASFTAALEDMRRTAVRLKEEGKIVLDSSTALVGSYWTIDYIEK